MVDRLEGSWVGYRSRLTCPRAALVCKIKNSVHMTKAMVQIAIPFGISVDDHIIAGKNGHASLRGPKLIWRCCPS
jgi:hypothetical protein